MALKNGDEPWGAVKGELLTEDRVADVDVERLIVVKGDEVVTEEDEPLVDKGVDEAARSARKRCTVEGGAVGSE